MAISRIGSNSAEATTVTIPAGHQIGDLMIIFAFNDGANTAPTNVTGWTSIASQTGNLTGMRTSWKFAASAAEASGTWTNATGLMVHVYRGVDFAKPVGTTDQQLAATSPSTYGSTRGVGKDKMDNQWFVAFQGHVSTDTTTLTNAPTGYTIVITALGATQDMVSFDTNAPVAVGFASNTVAPGGTAAGWQTVQLPIYPNQMVTNNYEHVRSISAGIISVTEKIR